MYDILVYLFENYQAPQACPRSDVLADKLAAEGFEHDDIDDALRWLQGLAITTEHCQLLAAEGRPSAHASRIYTHDEYRDLGTDAIGFIAFLEHSGALPPSLREILIECACSADHGPLTLAEIKVLALMVLWSQQAEVEHLIFEELLAHEEDPPLH